VYIVVSSQILSLGQYLRAELRLTPNADAQTLLILRLHLLVEAEAENASNGR